jgi:hypothetical protein
MRFEVKMQGGGGVAVTSHLEVLGPEPGRGPRRPEELDQRLGRLGLLAGREDSGRDYRDAVEIARQRPNHLDAGNRHQLRDWWRAMSASPFTTVSPPTRYIPAELRSGIYRLGDAETLEVEDFTASRSWEAGPRQPDDIAKPS